MNHSTNVQQRRCAGNPEKGGFYKITGITQRGEERIAVFRGEGDLIVQRSVGTPPAIQRVMLLINIFLSNNRIFLSINTDNR